MKISPLINSRFIHDIERLKVEVVIMHEKVFQARKINNLPVFCTWLNLYSECWARDHIKRSMAGKVKRREEKRRGKKRREMKRSEVKRSRTLRAGWFSGLDKNSCSSSSLRFGGNGGVSICMDWNCCCCCCCWSGLESEPDINRVLKCVCVCVSQCVGCVGCVSR